jgi:hypothetical protein
MWPAVQPERRRIKTRVEQTLIESWVEFIETRAFFARIEINLTLVALTLVKLVETNH